MAGAIDYVCFTCHLAGFNLTAQVSATLPYQRQQANTIPKHGKKTGNLNFKLNLLPSWAFGFRDAAVAQYGKQGYCKIPCTHRLHHKFKLGMDLVSVEMQRLRAYTYGIHESCTFSTLWPLTVKVRTTTQS